MATTDIAVIGGGLSLVHAVEEAKKAGLKVTACVGNVFMEWSLAAGPFIADPDKHEKWIAGDPETWKIKGVDYIFGAVTEILPDTKVIKFANNPDLTYRAVIIATGSKLPLIMPKPGDSLEQRMLEVKEAGVAIANARTVVINGAGLVGLELAGDIRAMAKKRSQQLRIVILSRDGTVLGSTHPPEWQERVKARLDIMNIEVVKGSVPALDFVNEPKLEAGTITLDTGDIASDVFIPAFAQRPNTAFLDETKAVNEKKQIIANECLQSTEYPEIFGVGVTSIPLLGHPVSSRLTAQAKTCATNSKLFLCDKPLVPHKDKEGPPPSKYPMNVKIGHGKGGYMFWDTSALPAPAMCCCCLWCKGGYPCCPPPCCWCCSRGCSNCFGNCCGPAESEGAAIFMIEFLLPKFPGNHGFKGMGKKPVQQSMTQ